MPLYMKSKKSMEKVYGKKSMEKSLWKKSLWKKVLRTYWLTLLPIILYFHVTVSVLCCKSPPPRLPSFFLQPYQLNNARLILYFIHFLQTHHFARSLLPAHRGRVCWANMSPIKWFPSRWGCLFAFQSPKTTSTAF